MHTNANSPGVTNHIISGSPTIVETALEHDRIKGPLTLTTGTAEISNALEEGADGTSFEAAAAAGDAAFRGSEMFTAASRLEDETDWATFNWMP
jgi:hypothetical protein